MTYFLKRDVQLIVLNSVIDFKAGSYEFIIKEALDQMLKIGCVEKVQKKRTTRKSKEQD